MALDKQFGYEKWLELFNCSNIINAGMTRMSDSWVVAVPGKTDKAKKTLYWPVVGKLRKVTK